MAELKSRYLQRAGVDKDFFELPLLVQQYDIDTVTAACELASEEKTTQLPAIINQINRLYH